MMQRKSEFGFTPRRPRRRQRPELSEEQAQEIKEAFELFDTDKNGAIGSQRFLFSHPLDTFMTFFIILDYHELKVLHNGLIFALLAFQFLFFIILGCYACAWF